MCLLKCAEVPSDSIPASGLFVARRTFISLSQLCKSYSRANRPSSVFSALLSASISRFSSYLPSLFIYLFRRFFDNSLSQETLGSVTRFIALYQSSMLRLSLRRQQCPIMEKLIFHIEMVILNVISIFRDVIDCLFYYLLMYYIKKKICYLTLSFSIFYNQHTKTYSGLFEKKC